MEQSTFAIIVLVATLVLYTIPKIPLSVTTILAMLSLAMFGIVDYAAVFSGFSHSVIFLIAGLMVIGQATVTTGLAQRFGAILTKTKAGNNEKSFIIVLFIISAFISTFVNAALTVAIFMPIINAVVLKSKGKVTKKGTYMALGLSSVLGNNLLTISATSMLTAVSVLSEAGYGQMAIYAPLAVNLPAVLAVIIMYALFGKKLQDKWFDFEEIPITDAGPEEKTVEYPVWKQILVAVDLVVVVIALLMKVNYGLASLLGASVLVLTGCIGEKKAFNSIGWSTIVIVAGAMGLSKGIMASGAGVVIADFFIKVSGPLGHSALGMSIVLFFIATLISNVMSDNATVAIMLPIGMSIAQTMGIDPTGMFLAICSGTKVALATPICVAPMTQIGVAGYRFKDYLKMGGLVNLISMVVTMTAIAIIYY